MAWIWEGRTVDAVFFIVLCIGLSAGVATIAVQLWRYRSSGETRDINKAITAMITTTVAIAAIYVTYSAFRNQARLASETATYNKATNLENIELQDENLRCLYGNYGWNHPEACLAANTSSAAQWSKAVLYIESSLFLLEKAGTDNQVWGSHYADQIKYWSDDVSADPTGMFSYYALNRHGVAGAKEHLALARVCIADLCAGYLKVRQALAKAGAVTSGPDLCASPQARQAARMQCPL